MCTTPHFVRIRIIEFTYVSRVSGYMGCTFQFWNKEYKAVLHILHRLFRTVLTGLFCKQCPLGSTTDKYDLGIVSLRLLGGKFTPKLVYFVLRKELLNFSKTIPWVSAHCESKSFNCAEKLWLMLWVHWLGYVSYITLIRIGTSLCKDTFVLREQKDHCLV